jgi:hypothetical protein
MKFKYCYNLKRIILQYNKKTIKIKTNFKKFKTKFRSKVKT